MAVRALSWLALSSLSLAWALAQLHAPPTGWTTAWRGNQLYLRDRLPILAVVTLLVGGGLLAAAIWLRRRGLAQAPALLRVAHVTAPLALVGLLPGVVNGATWDDPLQACLVDVAFVVACEALLRLSQRAWLRATPLPMSSPSQTASPFGPSWLRERLPPLLVAVGVVAYAGYMSHFALLNHREFNTSAFDLGIYDNQFWQALHGHPFRSSPVLRLEGNWSVLKTHAELGMYALLPLYALHPHAETLLVLQSCALASGAVPIYRFAARRLSSRPIGSVLALAYLLYPAVHGANLYDFHFQPIAAACVLWAIDLLDDGRRVAFWILFGLGLSCREDISLMFFAYGAFLVVSGQRPRDGLLMGAIAIVYFAVVKFIVMPLVGSWWFAEMYKDLYPPDARGYGGILQTLAVNPIYTLRTLWVPDKLRYLIQLFAPLAFLPLRRLRLYWLLFPGAFLTLLSTRYPATVSLGFQYGSYWFALAFPATVYALERLRDEGDDGRARLRAALGALVVGSIVLTAHFGAIPPRSNFPSGFGRAHFEPITQANRDKARDLAQLAALVPPAARLAVSENELPHVSGRAECYSLKNGAADAEYVIYASGSLGDREAEAELRAGRMKILATRPGLFLLQRK